MKPFQKKLVAAWKDYAAGKIDAAALKGASAGFGIYQQRDGATMMRLRRPAGVVTTWDLRLIAGLLERFGAPFCHLTTRLDIQMHGVKAEDVPLALEACEELGFRFRGGGGDTFRNVHVNPGSGLHADTVFDVIPYVRALSAAFYGFDTAYGLPRKIKIGFVDRPADANLAKVQDLGFVAKTEGGKRVFETWVAGGIGSKPRVGFKLFDALPAEECCRLAFALTRMFNERGCRTNRAHARIRFLREDMGDENFAAALKEYYANETEAPSIVEATEGDDPGRKTIVLKPETWAVPSFAEGAATTDGFAQWRELAVTPLKDGLNAVRLFVPYGNLDSAQLRKLCDALGRNGVSKIQLLPTEDFCILNVPEGQLAAVYAMLAGEFGDVDYTVRSFRGHVLTCIGGGICKSGVHESPKFGDEVAKAFDKYLPADTPEKLEVAKLVLNDIRVSGCPNSCTNNPMAKYGFVCRKIDGEYGLMPLTGSCKDPLKLGELQRETVLCRDVPEWIRQNTQK